MLIYGGLKSSTDETPLSLVETNNPAKLRDTPQLIIVSPVEWCFVLFPVFKQPSDLCSDHLGDYKTYTPTTTNNKSIRWVLHDQRKKSTLQS
jgi:hypothetical protein